MTPQPPKPMKPFAARGDLQRRLWPWLAMATVLATTACVLRSEGRSWWCACGRLSLWSGDVWSSHNSQHLFDPYSLTHVLHGVVLCGLLAWVFPRLAPVWRLCLVIAVEAAWEIVENSEFVIQRYRTLTMALDYHGDSVANSLGDILSCGVGFSIARRLGFLGSLALFLATEGVLVIWIRDSLLLNVLMLICPIDAIKAWQMGS